MARKPAAPTVHVVLDTNCLFTEAADKLVCAEVSEFILKSIPEYGVQLQWYLPSIVKGERKYQMLERAMKLLPNLVKLEQLLGHALGINAEVLSTRVNEAINRQVDLHKLAELDVSHADVDWSRIIDAAIMRLPPFSSGEKEKGFRDSIVLESFAQLVDRLPKTPTTARVVLLTGDKLLADAAQARTSDRTNVTIAADLDTLRTLLNAIASQLTQEAVEKIVPRANDLFFKPQDNETLYYKWDIRKKIDADFREKVREAPEPKLHVRVEKTLVGPTTFLNKQGQRLSLSTKIVMNAVAYERVPQYVPSQPNQLGLLSGVLPTSAAPNTWPGTATPGLLYGSPSNLSTGVISPSNALAGITVGSLNQPIPEIIWTESIRHRGTKSFDAIWEVTLMRNGSLSNAKLDKVEFRATSWGE